ncbi:MAG: Gfo/Idh/MocA family oxidoreductase [Candidatus Latescibacterota bacterium]|nr:Gfo/Idh/MocA family oxidoreductase [Candidatus Latescibacterota bacterium]
MVNYRVGLIGAGRKGTQHARAYMLDERAEVVAVADGDPENLSLFQKRTGVAGYADYREMLEQEGVDIAAPILPVSANPEVVIDCAEAGVKAILCEKPIAASLEEVDRMVAVCKSRRVVFGAGDLDVNLPVYQRALEFIGAGELGVVKSISLLGGPGTEMSGGGCQRFTLMRHFAGCAELAWVLGWVGDDPLSDHDQGGAGYVRFANGIEGFIYREQDARGRGYEVACEGGVFRSDDHLAGLYRYAEGDGASWDKLEKIEGVLPAGPIYGEPRGYDAEGWKWPGDRNVASCKAIIDALERGEDPPGSGENGRVVLEMAIALRESHRRGCVPVSLPLIDRSMRIIPSPSRMYNKKPIFGREKYMDQVLSHKKD